MPSKNIESKDGWTDRFWDGTKNVAKGVAVIGAGLLFLPVALGGCRRRNNGTD